MRAVHAVWTWVFLPLTALAVLGEFVAAFDSSKVTAPWTDYITTYLPPWVTFALFGVLVAWFPAHIATEYRRKGKSWPGI